MCGEGTIQSLLETKAHRYVYVEVTIQTLLETKAHRYVCVVRVQYKHS